jgi:hypothetical protein
MLVSLVGMALPVLGAVELCGQSSLRDRWCWDALQSCWPASSRGELLSLGALHCLFVFRYRCGLTGGALYPTPACQSATTPLLESPGLEVAGQLVLRVLRIAASAVTAARRGNAGESYEYEGSFWIYRPPAILPRLVIVGCLCCFGH